MGGHSFAEVEEHLKFNGHEYVDLGLPSGRLWAKCNIGATSETDYGLYFSWASNVGYAANGNTSSHDFSTGQQTPYYIRRDEDEYDVYARYVDGETLSLGDDAARNNMGGNWRMPTKDDYQELYDYCNTNGSVEWVTMNGVNGRKFTSPNGQYVFFPATGSCDGTSRTGVGSDGSYWSSTCCSIDGPGEDAHYCYFDRNDVAITGYFRYGGFSVRGVQ